jgi:hypothetical protein
MARIAQAGGTHIRDCIFECGGVFYNFADADPKQLPNILRHRFHKISSAEALGEPPLYLYMHPESGCAWLQDHDDFSGGDGCVEYIDAIAQSRIPRSQEAFQVYAEAHGIAHAGIIFRPDIIRKPLT